MILECSSCGKEIEIQGELIDGQHVLCPYCHEKSAYSKPSRIELPTAVRPVEKKHDLYVRKPTVDSKIKREIDDGKIKSVENRARIIEELKGIEVRRHRWGLVVNVVVTIFLLLGGLAGYHVWQTRRERAELAEAEAKLAEARAEAERQAAELQHKRELAELRAKEQAERDAKRKAEEALSRQREAVRVNRERFALLVSTLESGDLAFISELEKLPEKPAAIAYLLPHLENASRSFILVETATNGVESVRRLTSAGEYEETNREQLEQAMKDQDYLAIVDRKIYFHSRRKKPHVGTISKKKVVDLGDAFFGAMYKDISTIDADFPNLSFEIVFVPKNAKRGEFLVAEVVEYGSSYSLSTVMEALQEAYPPKNVKTDYKAKLKQIFEDGELYFRAKIK